MYPTPYVAEQHDKVESAARIRLAEHSRQVRQVKTSRHRLHALWRRLGHVKQRLIIDEAAGGTIAVGKESQAPCSIVARLFSPADR